MAKIGYYFFCSAVHVVWIFVHVNMYANTMHVYNNCCYFFYLHSLTVPTILSYNVFSFAVLTEKLSNYINDDFICAV